MTKALVFLLAICTELLISTSKISTFRPTPALGCEKVPFESNPIPYPMYLNSSIVEFLINLTSPNKELYIIG